MIVIWAWVILFHFHFVASVISCVVYLIDGGNEYIIFARMEIMTGIRPEAGKNLPKRELVK